VTKIFYLPVNEFKDRVWDWAMRNNMTINCVVPGEIEDDHALYTVTYTKGGNTDTPHSPGILMMVNKGGSLNRKRSMI